MTKNYINAALTLVAATATAAGSATAMAGFSILSASYQELGGPDDFIVPDSTVLRNIGLLLTTAGAAVAVPAAYCLQKLSS